MKLLSTLLASSALVCLWLVPPVQAGPGGSYGPSGTTPRGYNPDNRGYDGGGFGGGFSHRGHDHDHDHDHDADDFRSGSRDRPYYDRDRDNDRDRRPVVVVQPARTGYDRRPIQAHRPSYYNGGWYHGDWHSNWDKSLRARPYSWGGWGNNGSKWNTKGSNSVVSSPWRFGYWSYSNPYYTHAANSPSYFNYSQPIVATNITVDASGQYLPQVIGQSSREQALQLFSGARAAFFAGDLRSAQSQIDQAIRVLPGDTVLHEFRALVLFAHQDFDSAAGAIYSVLSSGPGWDWTTMIGLYPNARIYTGHLRVLEEFCNANPRATSARFVLAYHYLTAGHADAAAEMFRQVVRLNPRDSLSAQLLASLTGVGVSQVAQLQPLRSQRIDNQYLVGNWTATRDDGSTFNLTLRNDGAFRWEYSQYGNRQQLVGSYTLDDGMLVLQQDGQPAMVGQIIPLAGNRFVFKLTGGDPNDPGLNFYR